MTSRRLCQPALFDMEELKGPPEKIGRARRLVVKLERLGGQALAGNWWREYEKTLQLARELKADTVLSALCELADEEAVGMLGFDHLQIEAEKAARRFLEPLERARVQ